MNISLIVYNQVCSALQHWTVMFPRAGGALVLASKSRSHVPENSHKDTPRAWIRDIEQ